MPVCKDTVCRLSWDGKRGCQAMGGVEVSSPAAFGHRTLRIPRILNSNQAFQVSLKANKPFYVMTCYLDLELLNGHMLCGSLFVF